MSKSYTQVMADARETSRRKTLDINDEVEDRVKDLALGLGLQISIENPTDYHKTYVLSNDIREIRVGGGNKEPVKRIIVIDKVQNSIIYTGNFKEDADYYVKIVKVYGARAVKSKGFRNKL